MVKKLTVLLLIVCLVFPPNSVALALSNDVVYDDIAGTVVSKDYFKETYGNESPTQQLEFARTNSETPIPSQADILNISLSNGEVFLIANISSNGDTVSLPISGQLYSSYKLEDGINCMIVDADCAVDGYKILLFEIYNDTSNDAQLLLNTSINGTPHIKLYIQHEDNAIYIFEFAISGDLLQLNAAQYARADKSIDFLWPLQVVDGISTEVPTDENMLQLLGLSNATRSTNTWTLWAHETIFMHSFNYAGYHYSCMSLPCVEYRYTNVTSQDSTWVASFKVAEHTSYYDILNKYETLTSYHGNNVYEYTDVSLAFACGDNTTFIRTYQQGRMTKQTLLGESLKEFGDEITATIFKKAVNTLINNSTITTLLENLNTITFENKKVTLGSTGIDLNNTLTVVAGEKLSGYTFEECTDQDGADNVGDYFTFQAVTQYENAGGNSSTMGLLSIEFTVLSSADYSETPYQATIELPYTANP